MAMSPHTLWSCSLEIVGPADLTSNLNSPERVLVGANINHDDITGLSDKLTLNHIYSSLAQLNRLNAFN